MKRLVRLGFACILLAGFVAVSAWQYPLLARLMLHKEIAVVVVAASGFLLYCVAVLAFRAVTIREIRGALRREAGPAPGSMGGGGGLQGGADG